MDKENKKEIVTDSDLIKRLQQDELDSFLIIVDEDGNEYTIKDVTLAMGGQFHQVIELERNDNPRERFFRSHQVILEEMEENLKMYKSEEWKADAIKNCTPGWYDDFVKKQEAHYEYMKKYYAEQDNKKETES